ncbi:LysO family transporter [Angelakisella massiliensis]|uniref:LysO family transporter n=1 Tax=Angelakisella massiliensis TaxID=1871018 RepID=UPI0008F8E796|nr:LysO family transporter [Angelakisella massiliensis]
MDVILVMLAGVLIGAKWFPERFKKQNETLQVVCTALLIFSMGVMLGQRENFLQELTVIGWQSLLFALVPAALSGVVVFLMTRRWKQDEEKKEEN